MWELEWAMQAVGKFCYPERIELAQRVDTTCSNAGSLSRSVGVVVKVRSEW